MNSMLKIFENSLKNRRFVYRLTFKKLFQTNKSPKYLSRLQFSTQSQNYDQKDENNYDIVINGGGIVGFSLFLALKNCPFVRDKKICLIERQSKVDHKSLVRSDDLFSNRVSSITTSSKTFFQDIDIWNDLKDYSKPIEEFYVWSQKYRNAINFRFDNNLNEDISRDDIVCYIIENNRILSSLQSKVNRFEQNVCYETVVTHIRSDTNSVQIQTKCLKTDNNKDLTTRLLIGCDGFQSIVRQKSNLNLFEHDLEQFGIVGTIAVHPGEGNPYNKISFQRFVPFDNSVIALLPLSQEFCSFVWSVPKELANDLMQMNENQFVDHMNDSLFIETTTSDTLTSKVDDLMSRLIPKQTFSEPTPRYTVPHILSLLRDSRAAFPLKFSTTLPYMVGAPKDSVENNRIVILGDAAHRVHPLAGQGLNLGIGDVQVLSECLHQKLFRGETLFGECVSDAKQLENCLFDFERKRQIKVIPMLSAIHSMQQLFAYIPTQFISVFNSSEFLKHRIIEFANKI